MTTLDLYEKLMIHFSQMGMMTPPREDLLIILKSNFSKEEVNVLLSIPSKKIPFQGVSINEISNSIEIPLQNLKEILDSTDYLKIGYLLSDATELAALLKML